ncbi:uncharacterized protein LOC110466994 [Mizuhopecten yessoensis]|uniref:Ankyrin-3 n=1 Tax=Mizuhopecten yessoensis TaxID=6573 RepID=A0A210R6N1_MIZYE|nr:uncharacterized protein LOC110466994 [Mizuhopecten yessoensis]OWF56709.1 Ankyrin-3 [Mizuhopecten yessoensis]
MGSTVCKSVKVKSFSPDNVSRDRQSEPTLVGVRREPVEHGHEESLSIELKDAGKTDNECQKQVLTPTRRKPDAVEHEEATSSQGSLGSVSENKLGTSLKSTPREYDETVSPESEGRRARVVEPVEETLQEESSVIARENEAVPAKGDPDGKAYCINPAGSAKPPFNEEHQNVAQGHGRPTEGSGDTYNIYVANREIRLKGVISKCCQSYLRDDVMFVKVPAYKAARDHLLKDNMLTLTGTPGEGKTLLARHLLLDMARNDNPDIRMDEVILASTPDDWKDHINPNKRQFVLIEDIFGISNLSRYRLDMWRPVLDTIARVVREQKGKLCVVITSRRHILEEARDLIKDCPFLSDKDIINLTEFPLNSDIKREILVKHVQDLTEEQIQNIISCDVPHGFPYCCRMFSLNTHLRLKGPAFFKNPVGYIKDEVDSLRRTDVVKYCALVLCMLNDGHIERSELDITQLDEAGKTRLRNILQLTEIPLEISTTSLIDALDNLTCLYLINCENTYRFMHPCLLEVVTEMCSRYIPGAIVKHCSPNFLHERVRIRTRQTRCGEGYVVLLEQKEFKFLASRFYEEVKAKRIKGAVQHEACRDDNFVKFFTGFLEKENLGTDIVCHFDSSSRSILYWCAWTGSSQLLAYLLHGLNPGDIPTPYINQQKSMSLVAASFFGFSDIVQTLLQSVTEVNFCDFIQDRRINSKYKKFGFSLGRLMYISPTPLHAAVCGGSKTIVEKLLYYQANINAKTTDGDTPLHIAVCTGNVDIVDVLLKNVPRADVNAVDVYLRTPLHVAAGISGIFDVIPKEYAMEMMTCVRIKDPHIRKQNTLHIAKSLIENGSSVNCQDYSSDTPLHTALTDKNFHLAETLIPNNDTVDIHNVCGDTCLHLAAKFGQTNICKLLIDRNSDVNSVHQTDKTTPLHLAVESGEAETVKYLVDTAGASRDVRNKEEETPLDIAKRLKFHDGVAILEIEADEVTSF